MNGIPRILCFLHSFEPGGVERTALHLCTAWQDAGADVAVMLGRDEGRLRGEAPDLDYIVPLPPHFSTAPIETLWMIICLPRIILRWRPDALFCAGNSYTVVAVLMKLLLGNRCPPVVAKISNDLIRSDLPWLVRIFYRLWCRLQGGMLDHLVALSPAMRDEIVEVMRVKAGRVTTIGDGVLEEEQLVALAKAGALSRATRTDGRRFIAIGRLVAQKDFALLIRAFSSGGRATDQLIIVGEGSERPKLEKLVRDHDLESRIRLVGHCDRVEHWFAQSDVLLLSSRYEGLPAVVIEAMAAGLPVIATNCCASLQALLGHGLFGLLVGPDSKDFAQALAMASLAEHDPDRAASVAARFTVKHAAGLYLDLFVDVVETTTGVAPGRVNDWNAIASVG